MPCRLSEYFQGWPYTQKDQRPSFAMAFAKGVPRHSSSVGPEPVLKCHSLFACAHSRPTWPLLQIRDPTISVSTYPQCCIQRSSSTQRCSWPIHDTTIFSLATATTSILTKAHVRHGHFGAAATTFPKRSVSYKPYYPCAFEARETASRHPKVGPNANCGRLSLLNLALFART